MSRLAVLGTLAGVVIVALGCIVSIAHAQDPVGGALATLAAATSQAQARQWARQAEATRQAQSLEATSQAQIAQAEATCNAQSLEATAAAVSIAATRAAHFANVNATATRSAQDAEAQSTRQAIDAEATRAAYDVQLAEIKERSNFGTLLLYLAGILALAGCVYVALAWARALANKVKPVTSRASVVEGNFTPVLMLPAGPATMPEPRTVNDPRIIEAIGQWFYSEDNANE